MKNLHSQQFYDLVSRNNRQCAYLGWIGITVLAMMLTTLCVWLMQ